MSVALGFLRRSGFHLFAATVVAFLVTPFVISLLVSFFPGRSIGLPTIETGLTLDWYGIVLTDPLYRQGLVNSAVVGVLVAAVSLTLALPLVIGLSRTPRLRWLTGAIVIPATVPTVILGMQSLVAFEALGIRGSLLSIVAAHSLWGLPLAMLVLKAAHDRLDPGLLEAARSLGAGAARATWEVTLPLLGPALVVGAILAFVASLNELVMSLFLAGGNVRTLPTVVWPQVRHAVRPDVAAASSILLVVALVATGLAYLLWRGQTNRA
ncbi:ABC transporter permease [Euzebya tangerina]|uniref:ABC transporter permease n=1 Tax=Euzebya tangerina TaxID=591198 RepID=UPI0013C2AA90|nr:ABC transporter permease [Euzebya tangerina]